MNALGIQQIAAYEHKLLEYGTQALSQIPGLKLIGTAQEKASVLSFVIEGIHPHDIGTVHMSSSLTANSQMKLQMKREALTRLNRQAGDAGASKHFERF